MARAAITDEDMHKLVAVVHSLSLDRSGTFVADEGNLKKMLAACGLQEPGHKVREYADSMAKKHSRDAVPFSEFSNLVRSLREARDPKFADTVKTAADVKLVGGTSHGTDSILHTIAKEEEVAFGLWINRNLADDTFLRERGYLPIDKDASNLYEKCRDGVLLCKMINVAQAGTIFEKALNLPNQGQQLTIFKKNENLNVAINSAKSIGCYIVNVGPRDIDECRAHIVLGVIWQIIRHSVMTEITLANHAELVQLLEPGETPEDLRKLSPEALLMRWVNYHLAKAGVARRMVDFGKDLRDCEIFTHVMAQVAPAEKHVSKAALNEHDERKRAEITCGEADKLGVGTFLSAAGILACNTKLNSAFLASLFNAYPGLTKPETPVEEESKFRETREEKTYRCWMNSLGVKPYVSYLYSDLRDGLIFFQIYDAIRPGSVEWRRVHKEFNRLRAYHEKLENCNYAVELGKAFKFSLVGIAGQDILDGNQTLTLALVWQLMRAYTLSILERLAGGGKQVGEKEIIEWVNSKLRGADKKSSITSFQDHSIGTSRAILDLIDALRPGSVNWSFFRTETEEDKMNNAKYALTTARKIGALVYALPEDIVEVKQKMVMTIFACLMVIAYDPSNKRPAEEGTTPTGY